MCNIVENNTQVWGVGVGGWEIILFESDMSLSTYLSNSTRPIRFLSILLGTRSMKFELRNIKSGLILYMLIHVYLPLIVTIILLANND